MNTPGTCIIDAPAAEPDQSPNDRKPLGCQKPDTHTPSARLLADMRADTYTHTTSPLARGWQAAVRAAQVLTSRPIGEITARGSLLRIHTAPTGET